MKDVLITSYEGNVMLYDLPNNMKRNEVMELARIKLQQELNKPITDLYNVDYLVNSKAYNRCVYTEYYIYHKE